LKSFTLLNFTILLIISSLIGVNYIKFDLGFFQLSIFRFLLIFSFLFYSKILKKSLNQIKVDNNNFYLHFLFFWIIYSLITVIWVNDMFSWIKSLTFIVIGLYTTIIIFAVLDNKTKIKKAIDSIVLASFLIFFLAFYEMFTGNYLFVTEGNLEYYQEFSLLQSATGFREPVTFFGNPNNYSLFLYFTFVFGILNYKIKLNKFVKVYYGFVALIAFFLIVCTQSRSGFIGCGIFLLSLVFISFLKNSLIGRLRMFFVLSILFIGLFYYLNDNFDFFRDVITIDLSNNSSGSSDDIRKNLIRNGIHFLYSSYFMGVGVGNIEYYMSNFPKYNTGDTTNIHNWWMEILVSSGVVIFCFYILVYAKSTYHSFKYFFQSKNLENKKIYSVFLCFFLGFIVSSIGPSSLIDNEWYWTLMAICFKISTESVYKLEYK
jgi:teichuronic acid biosynthesis protein TuaE